MKPQPPEDFAGIRWAIFSIEDVRKEVGIIERAIGGTAVDIDDVDMSDEELEALIRPIAQALSGLDDPRESGTWSALAPSDRRRLRARLVQVRRALQAAAKASPEGLGRTQCLLLPVALDERFLRLVGMGELTSAWLVVWQVPMF
jgi:hypothetical protein